MITHPYRAALLRNTKAALVGMYTRAYDEPPLSTDRKADLADAILAAWDKQECEGQCPHDGATGGDQG